MSKPMHLNKTVEDRKPVAERRRFLDWARRLAIRNGATGIHTNEKLAEYGLAQLAAAPRTCTVRTQYSGGPAASALPFPSSKGTVYIKPDHDYFIVTRCTNSDCPHIGA